MKIHFLGTCAGTEPMPDRKHASVAVEAEGRIYWFDAGEGCSYTGHLMGLDLLKVGKIIISHAHMDHVGGLGNLLWNIRKLTFERRKQPEQGEVVVYTPNMDSWNGLLQMLRNTEQNFQTKYPVYAVQVEAGELFDDGIIKVTAFPNTHLVEWQQDRCLSYSYLIECDGKKLVYSGDVGSYDDLNEAIGKGCDGLIIETGHFGIDEVQQYVSGKNIRKIFFSHNGREIISNPEASKEKVKNYFGNKGFICEDGMTIEL
ncbi:MAG: MBL fold metallo-hydrolase [Lachnospiraceae bacterium]|nr:MBL fold metallo-hydrolase [Lachnospiraceae bacterium]